MVVGSELIQCHFYFQLNNVFMARLTGDKIEILDKTLKSGFAPTPRIVLRHPKLSRNSKTTYSLLLDYAWQSGSCFPGQQTLANDLGVSIRTIQRDLEELKNFGLIDWKQRGKNRTNIYYILPLDFLTVPKNHQPKPLMKVDTTKLSYPDTTNLSGQGTTDMSHIIEEVEYKQNKYKQSLTLKNSNDNEKLNLDTFDSEAIFIAEELNDIKSIKYYQKIINQKKQGLLHENDIQKALDETRKAISESRSDGTNFLKNPAGWFVSNLQRFSEKRKQSEQKSKIEELMEKFKPKWGT